MSAPLVRREFRARPGRILIVFATVVVAVAFTSGAFGFSEQLTRLLAPSEDDAGAAPARRHRGHHRPTTTGSRRRRRSTNELLGAVRAVPGVASASGQLRPARGLRRRVAGPARSSRPAAGRGAVVGVRPGAVDAFWRVGHRQVRPRWRSTATAWPWPASTWAASVGSRFPSAPSTSAWSGVRGGVRRRVRQRCRRHRPGDRRPVHRPGTTAAAAVALASAHVVIDPASAPDPAGCRRPGRPHHRRPAARDLDRRSWPTASGPGLPSGVRLDAITSASAATQQTVGTIEDGVRLATVVYAGITVDGGDPGRGQRAQRDRGPADS